MANLSGAYPALKHYLERILLYGGVLYKDSMVKDTIFLHYVSIWSNVFSLEQILMKKGPVCLFVCLFF